jgi:hypothetical protein
MRGFLVFLSVAVLGLLGASAGARADEAPAPYCRGVVNDDVLRPPPETLAPAIERLFSLANAYPPGAAFYRCAGGDVMVCVVGASLPCGKANTSTALPAADEWCRTNVNAEFIPMYVTGHDTIYEWRCTGSTATTTGPTAKLDARGFFAEYWRKFP